jgi:hypothetical protein
MPSKASFGRNANLSLVELPRFRRRCRTFGQGMDVDGLAPRFASARGGAADRAGEAPPLPVRHAAGGMTQPGSRDFDAEDLAGMGDHEIADPLGQGWSTYRRGMLALARLLQRAPLGVGEADEDPVPAGMRQGRSPVAHHGLSDITISGGRTSTLGEPSGARWGRSTLVGERRQVREG